MILSGRYGDLYGRQAREIGVVSGRLPDNTGELARMSSGGCEELAKRSKSVNLFSFLVDLQGFVYVACAKSSSE